MALRWTCATAMDASKRFRRLKAYRSLPRLIKALRDHDRHLGFARNPSSIGIDLRRLSFFNNLRDSTHTSLGLRDENLCSSCQ